MGGEQKYMNNNQNTEPQIKGEENQKKNLFENKKFKYGTSAVVFTIVFVAVVILANLVLSVIDAKTGGLYVDITTENIYKAGTASVEAINELDNDIEIIFGCPSDKIKTVAEYNAVRLLCEDFEQKCDNIEVIYKDALYEKSYFSKFENNEINQYSVIINCPGTKKYKVIPYFYELYDTNFKTFYGEGVLTSQMLTVAGNEHTVGFVTGHTEDDNMILKTFFSDNGYAVYPVDIETSSRQDLKKYDMLVICDPKQDFKARVEGSTTSESEVEKLRDYVKEDFGNVMLFVSPSSYDLTNLFSLFKDDFGVEIDNASVVYDTELAVQAIEGCFYSEYYTGDAESEGYLIHSKLSESTSAKAPVFALSAALNIPKKETDYFEISPILVTGKDAEKSNDVSTVSYGSKPLAAVSKYEKIVDSKVNNARVFTIASSDYPYFTTSSAYTNGELLKHIFANTGNENVMVDIGGKKLDDSTLLVSNSQVKNARNVLVVLIPLVIAAIGTAVYIRRKHL